MQYILIRLYIMDVQILQNFIAYVDNTCLYGCRGFTKFYLPISLFQKKKLLINHFIYMSSVRFNFF